MKRRVWLLALLAWLTTFFAVERTGAQPPAPSCPRLRGPHWTYFVVTGFQDAVLDSQDLVPPTFRVDTNGSGTTNEPHETGKCFALYSRDRLEAVTLDVRYYNLYDPFVEQVQLSDHRHRGRHATAPIPISLQFRATKLHLLERDGPRKGLLKLPNEADSDAQRDQIAGVLQQRVARTSPRDQLNALTEQRELFEADEYTDHVQDLLGREDLFNSRTRERLRREVRREGLFTR